MAPKPKLSDQERAERSCRHPASDVRPIAGQPDNVWCDGCSNTVSKTALERRRSRVG